MVDGVETGLALIPGMARDFEEGTNFPVEEDDDGGDDDKEEEEEEEEVDVAAVFTLPTVSG